jgi:hypothetical protein
VAELDMPVAALLRPGNTAFGAADIPCIKRAIDRVRNAVGPDCVIRVRIDGAGDCTEVLRAIEDCGAHYIIKADITADLFYTLATLDPRSWTTVDRDAFGKPTRQTQVVPFARTAWTNGESPLNVRVIAVRTTERDIGKQVYAWDGLDFSVQVYLTNDETTEPDDIAYEYNKRAGIEPLIGELKNGWGIGEVSTHSFIANHAMLLIKLLAHNLLRRYLLARAPALRSWRVAWVRRALIRVPGRLLRHGRQRILRTAPRPMLPALE